MAIPPRLGPEARARLRLAAGHVGRALRYVLFAVRRVGHHLIAAVVAAIVVFEEWGWQPLAALLGKLARFAPIAAIEAVVQRLPPYGALAVFALPSALLLPLKLLALYLIAQGHTGIAAVLFVGAKVVGTAIVARIYMLTERALMQIAWFKRGYDFLMPLKNALVAWARASAVWKYGRLIKAQVKRALAPVIVTVRRELTRILSRFRGIP